ncbi:hypothetical protein T492DRAFT_870211 [Pavlovales sp. CCMP2436]|nr:hypothetical protein T492DRAFT_870211 [Pavlovales sp. CCMP2436]
MPLESAKRHVLFLLSGALCSSASERLARAPETPERVCSQWGNWTPPPPAKLRRLEVDFARQLESRESDLRQDPQNVQYPFQERCDESHLRSCSWCPMQRLAREQAHGNVSQGGDAGAGLLEIGSVLTLLDDRLLAEWSGLRRFTRIAETFALRGVADEVVWYKTSMRGHPSQQRLGGIDAYCSAYHDEKAGGFTLTHQSSLWRSPDGFVWSQPALPTMDVPIKKDMCISRIEPAAREGEPEYLLTWRERRVCGMYDLPGLAPMTGAPHEPGVGLVDARFGEGANASACPPRDQPFSKAGISRRLLNAPGDTCTTAFRAGKSAVLAGRMHFCLRTHRKMRGKGRVLTEHWRAIRGVQFRVSAPGVDAYGMFASLYPRSQPPLYTGSLAVLNFDKTLRARESMPFMRDIEAGCSRLRGGQAICDTVDTHLLTSRDGLNWDFSLLINTTHANRHELAAPGDAMARGSRWPLHAIVGLEPAARQGWLRSKPFRAAGGAPLWLGLLVERANADGDGEVRASVSRAGGAGAAGTVAPLATLEARIDARHTRPCVLLVALPVDEAGADAELELVLMRARLYAVALLAKPRWEHAPACADEPTPTEPVPPPAAQPAAPLASVKALRQYLARVKRLRRAQARRKRPPLVRGYALPSRPAVPPPAPPLVAVAGAAGAPFDDADTVASLRRYLSAVYPAIAQPLLRASAASLRELYESLDYFYDVDALRGLEMAPRVTFTNLSSFNSLGARDELGPPQLPFLPAGVYYDADSTEAAGKILPSWTARGSFVAWSNPVRVLEQPLLSPARLHSVVGSRLGPAPSWTSPMAVVRYVWWPAGFAPSAIEALAAAAAEPDGRPRRPLGTGARALRTPLADGGAPEAGGPGGLGGRLARLRALKDGDYLEVEGFGGPLWTSDERSSPGVWANVWRGTGVFIRVSSPFVSTSKGIALAEMLIELGGREAAGGTGAVRALGDALGLGATAARLRARFTGASSAEALATAMFAVRMPADGPCSSATRGARAVLQNAWDGPEWLRKARRGQLHPNETVHRLRFAGDGEEPGAYGLYWQGGAPWASYDGLLAALACLLGAQELVDYEAHENSSWPKIVARGPGAPINVFASCVPTYHAANRTRPDAGELAAHWAATHKLALGDPRKPLLGAEEAAAPTLPCDLFGGRAPWTRRRNGGQQCVVEGSAWGNTPHAAALNCHMYCKGAMSEAHRSVPIAAVYRRRPEPRPEAAAAAPATAVPASE